MTYCALPLLVDSKQNMKHISIYMYSYSKQEEASIQRCLNQNTLVQIVYMLQTCNYYSDATTKLFFFLYVNQKRLTTSNKLLITSYLIWTLLTVNY